MTAAIKKRYRRSKSLKVVASEGFAATVFSAAAYLTIHASEISSKEDQPSIHAMRTPLMPAYTVIAHDLAQLLKDDTIKPETLFGLQVSMLPILGTYSVSVNHKVEEGVYQPYELKVSAMDHKNTFLRLNEIHGYDVAQNFVESI